MQRRGQLIIGIVVAAFVFWIGWTSPSLKQCLQAAYYNNPEQPLTDYVISLFGSFVGYRICVGEFVHSMGDGIIATFIVILGIATWSLWLATRELVNEARETAGELLKTTKVAADASTKSANAATAATRAYVCYVDTTFEPIRNIEKLNEEVVRVKVVFTNVGSTPALECEIVQEPVIIVPFGTNYDLLAERPAREENDLKTFIHLAAGKSTATNPLYIPRADIERAERREIDIFILASIEYKDVVDPNSERITDVSVKMRIICPVFDMNDPRPMNERIRGSLHRSRMT